LASQNLQKQIAHAWIERYNAVFKDEEERYNQYKAECREKDITPPPPRMLSAVRDMGTSVASLLQAIGAADTRSGRALGLLNRKDSASVGGDAPHRLLF
jgi:hypothetical protein